MKTMDELKAILERFADSGWELIAVPSRLWLDGQPDLPMLRNAILQATGVAIDSCPITPHILYRKFKEAGLIED